MKKSNILFIASVMSCLVGITAANIKLKSEYNKKNIASYYKETALPAFHHIKEMAIPDSAGFSLLEINIVAFDSFKLAKTFYADIEENLHYEVINDTLYIKMQKPFTQSITPLTIYCNNLQSIEGRHSRIFLNVLESEKLKVIAEHVSFIKMQNCTISQLSVHGKNNSTIVLADKCIIDSGSFHMSDKSILSLYENQIGHKEFLLGDDVTLSLKGRIIEEFTSSPKK